MTVKIENILSQIWSSTYSSSKVLDKNGFERIAEEVNFIQPDLNGEDEYPVKEPFIIISAPGAVGKTTFAKFCSHQKKGFYWDLSKIKLGDNSFIGTIAEHFGAEELPKAIVKIATGEIPFFIDAFDEAEIISGWDGVEKFVRDIYRFCTNANKPCIVLFSRSDTAALLAMLLEDIEKQKKIYSLYEIEYFDFNNATIFIKSYLKRKGDSNFEIHISPFEKAVKAIFDIIGKGINNDEVDIWQNKDIKSFIGYAPVLETIASYLFNEKNYEELANRLTEQSVEGGVKVILDFIDKLLIREQKDKFINGLKGKVEGVPYGWDSWDEIYTPDEQLKMVLNYLSGRILSNLPIPDSVPDWMRKEYQDALFHFLPNHPFIRGKFYSSPAFRDYSLAKLINDDNYSTQCQQMLGSGKFVLTQLFSIFYPKFNNNICLGSDVGYLYESVASRAGLNEDILTVVKTGEDKSYTLEILNTVGSGYNNVDMKCIIDDDNPLVFERRLQNATIDIDNTLVLGKTGGSIELSSVTIHARKINILSKELIVNCQSHGYTTIISEDVNIEDYNFSIRTIGLINLKASFPSSILHPWTQYSFTPIEEGKNLKDEMYALKRILDPFRKHGKKEFGKHFEFIDNKIVKGSPLRVKMLRYLIDSKIIEKSIRDNQYYMHEDILDQKGISWGNLRGMILNDGLKSFLDDFKTKYQIE